MPRAYLPLFSVARPPLVTLSSGIQVVTRDTFSLKNLLGLEQGFKPHELKQWHEWHFALACNFGEGSSPISNSPETLLADAHLALQVAAPIGSILSVGIREHDDSDAPRFLMTEFEQFNGTIWSRMKGFNNIPPQTVESIANGVIGLLESTDPRLINPIRLFEHGLVSRNPYIRILLWVTAMDGIMMAEKESVFVDRLCALLGRESLVFPPTDGVYITRPLTVENAARDLFALRSEIAHGKQISKPFWEVREDLGEFLPTSAYSQPPRYNALTSKP